MQFRYSLAVVISFGAAAAVLVSLESGEKPPEYEV